MLGDETLAAAAHHRRHGSSRFRWRAANDRYVPLRSYLFDKVLRFSITRTFEKMNNAEFDRQVADPIANRSAEGLHVAVVVDDNYAPGAVADAGAVGIDD